MRIKNLVEMIKHNGLLTSMAQLEKLYRIAIENEEKLAESEARCAALAAENAHMQQVIGDVQTLYYESDGIVGYHLNGDIAKWDDVMPDLWSETPATDAFLAEVRAQGADECVRQLVTSDDDGFSDAPNICAMVAHQLRKGVQS
jgi:hypothetical protein